MKSDVLSGGRLEGSKKAFFDDLHLFSSNINSKAYSLLGNSSLISVGWADCFRTFIDQFKENEAAIKNLVISSLSYLNSTCPHAVELYVRTLVDGNSSPVREQRRFRVGSKQLIDDVTRENCDPYILQYSQHLVDCLYVAGSTGHITAKVRSDIDQCAISLEQGFKANCYIDDFFLEHIGDLELDNCKVIVVDGKIIDVSEVHHILQHSYETKQKFIIVSTGCSEDVSNTLFVNWSQNKTAVVPFFIQDDVSNVNELKDISLASGVTPCSISSGKLISSIDISEVPVCQVKYDRKKSSIRITPPKSSLIAISRLRRDLQQKISDCTVNDIRELLVKRLSKMSLRNVVLEIPGDLSAKGILEDKLNSFFSHVSRCAVQGVVDVREIYYPDYHTRFLPSQDAMIAINRAVSDRNAIDNIKAVIRLESF